MKNSEIFLSLYQEIEEYFQRELEANHHLRFYAMVDQMKKRNAAVRRYEFDLREFSDLRNAITHGNMGKDVAIAEPHQQVVDQLKRIKEEIMAPPPVMKLVHHPVQTVHADMKLSEAVSLMNQMGCGQLPVYEEERYMGIFNGEILLRWMRNHSEKTTLNLAKITLEEIIDGDRDQRHQVIFKPRTSSVYEIQETVERYTDKKYRLQAIIITENGLPTEKPLTIITSADLPLIFE